MTQAVLPGNDFAFILRHVQQRQGRSVATEAECTVCLRRQAR